MRTITITKNLYTIEELTGVNRENALDSVSRQRMEDFIEFHAEELRTSMQEAAERFGMTLRECNISLFDRSMVIVDPTGLPDDNEQLEDLAKWINVNTDDGTNGACPFTGVFYDCYFFDYFAHNGLAKPDTLREDVTRAIAYMLKYAVKDAEESILDDTQCVEYAMENELEFLEDGTIFNG